MDNAVKYDLARKYAVAFMHIFSQLLGDHAADICRAFHFCKKERGIISEFSTFVFQKKDQDQFIVQFVEYVGLPAYFFSLVQLLLKNGRFNLFVDVLQVIARAVCEQNNVQEIFIYSASPLSSENISKIEKFMVRCRKKAILHTISIVRPDLIAGIRIESNGFVWEYSVRKQLTAINAILHQEGIRYE